MKITEKLINKKIDELNGMKEEFNYFIGEMWKADNQKLFNVDLYSIGITYRSFLLISGFSDLIKNKNFISAVSLVRLHLDSLLQLYGVFLVKDPHVFVEKKMKGKQTNNIKDREGNKMTDGYIGKKFFEDENNIDFFGLKDVYNETSGFIHFSEKHIFSGMNSLDKNKFTMVISDKMNVSLNEEYESIMCMIKITEGILKYIHGWVYTKKNPHLCIKK